MDDGLDNDGDGSADEDDAEDSAYDYSLSPAHSTDIVFTGATTYDTEKSVTITMEDDALFEGSETAILTLANSTQTGALNGTQQAFTLTINNGTDVPPEFYFTTSTGTAIAILSNDETGRSSDGGLTTDYTETVYVTLSGASGVLTKVDYALNALGGGTASATGTNADYSFTAGTVEIPLGSTLGSFTFDVLHDNVDEADQTINFSLTANADGSATAHGTNSTDLVYTITDNDPMPVLNFSATAASVAENDGTYTVRIDIEDGADVDTDPDTSEQAILAYLNPSATTDASITSDASPITGANNATDYYDYVTFTNKEVTIAAGESFGTATITLSNDAVP